AAAAVLLDEVVREAGLREPVPARAHAELREPVVARSAREEQPVPQIQIDLPEVRLAVDRGLRVVRRPVGRVQQIERLRCHERDAGNGDVPEIAGVDVLPNGQRTRQTGAERVPRGAGEILVELERLEVRANHLAGWLAGARLRESFEALVA